MTDMLPIGIFDSGAGGLSVFSELVKELSHESFIYFADSANCPYGSKSPEKIIELSSKITEFLISKQCKAIVVACNTATAAAIDFLRANYSIPFIGMEPAVKPAAINTKTKSIGVLATAGTFKGRLYIETTRRYASDIKVCYQVGEGLVELVEQGDFSSTEAETLLMKYLNPMLDCNIDQIVLGCTHYPFFRPLLYKLLPLNVDIIDPAPAVAKQTCKVLIENNLVEDIRNKNSYSTFYSSGSSSVLKKIVENIEKNIERKIQNVSYIDNYIL
ncbi:MAG: glutamate racemase [Bacteroidales bacterium]|nr:glutamate racemase [Bacteroidales bacterium]